MTASKTIPDEEGEAMIYYIDKVWRILITAAVLSLWEATLKHGW